MSFIDISDNEYDRSESETDELYSPIRPPDSPNIFYSNFNNSNLNNFLILPSVPQSQTTTQESEVQTQSRIRVEIEELNVIPVGSQSSLISPTPQTSQTPQTPPSPPLIPLSNNLIQEPVQLNDIFSLPQLIQNLQLFTNNVHPQSNRFIENTSTRRRPFQLNHNDIIENVLQTSMEDTGGYKKVISDEGKEEIKFLEYKSSRFKEKKMYHYTRRF